MRKFKKLTLTLVALLSVTAGAWAQETVSVNRDGENNKWTFQMPASNVELQVEYEPTKVTMAANDNAMGTVEVAGQSKVEWTADTWKGWTADIKEYTVDDITMTSSESAHIREYISEDKYNNSLFFFVRKMVDDATVTFSTTGDPFSRIEFTMIGDYSQYNPDIIPNDNWTFEGKNAVWEGEATKSLTLQSCSTNVSKITFYKGAAIPDGVTVNGDGTFTVAKTATVTLKATPAEGYKFLYWEDDHTNTNPVREVTIESGMADKTYKAVFAAILYNVTFVEGTNLDEWTATPDTEVKKDTKVDIKYTGEKKVIGVKVEKKGAKADPSETITFSGGKNANYTYTGTHFSATGEADPTDGTFELNKWSSVTINATDGKTITKVVFSYRENGNNDLDQLSFSSGTFDGIDTVNDVNATMLSVTSTTVGATKLNGVTIYYK